MWEKIISSLYPLQTKFRGVYRNHSVCPSVCADSCPAHNFIMVWHYHITWFGLPYLAHGCITTRHSWSRYDLELWPQGQIYRVYDCVQASPFMSFDIVILCYACGYITMLRCVTYSHELCMTLTFDLNIKIIFSQWIWIWQDIFALWHRHTKFLHMGVSPWDMLCTFSTLVWLWPLTYMWVAGGNLCEFYSQFSSCFVCCQ